MKDYPRDWLTAPLGELGEIRLGRMLDAVKNRGVLKQYLRNINVRWFGFDLSDLRSMRIPLEERDELSVRNGDLFICEGGEPGRCAVWRLGDNDLVYQKALHRVRPLDGLIPEFLMYQLRHHADAGALSAAFTGTTIKHLTRQSLAGYEVGIPPKREQQRIADKLDAVLARADACRERLDRVPDILKHFRQAVLAAATAGNLTESWRSNDPTRADASILADVLHRAHEAAGGHKAGNAAPPTDGVHDLSADMFPARWQLLTLRDLVLPDRPITYGILKPGPEIESGVPYLRVADFPNERLELSNIRRTSPEIDQQFKRSRLRSGDLLMSIRGSVGRLIVIPESLEAANITQDSARLSIQPAVNRDLVLWYLRSELAQTRMKGATKGVAVRGVNIGDVRALQVPLPSRDEQDEIVRCVESLFAYADRLEARYSAARAQVERLTPALLAKAFRGELVAQDPNDEPAAVLLARIRAARAAAPAKPRGRNGATGSRTAKKRLELAMLSRKDIQDSHLTSILKERGPLTAESLWSASQLQIDEFYDQLKDEEARGLLRENRNESGHARMLEAVA